MLLHIESDIRIGIGLNFLDSKDESKWELAFIYLAAAWEKMYNNSQPAVLMPDKTFRLPTEEAIECSDI